MVKGQDLWGKAEVNCNWTLVQSSNSPWKAKVGASILQSTFL